MPKLEFYFAPGTSSMAPHIALHEIGAPFEPRALSFATNDQREASFRAINPEGKVPVLVIDGRPLTEVAAILFYLARTFLEAALLPKDIEAEAKKNAQDMQVIPVSTLQEALDALAGLGGNANELALPGTTQPN